MTARFRATGVNATPRWFWVYFRDTTLLAPRLRAVQVPWGLITPEYQGICDGINKHVADRMQAEAERAQQVLPLEKWE